MTRMTTTEVLRRSARGGQSYIASRHKLASSLLADPELALDGFGAFLLERLFKIQKNNWIVLSFNKNDWSFLDYVLEHDCPKLDTAYLSLIGEYILTNVDRVQRVYDVSAEISAALIRDRNGSEITDALNAFDDGDRQSLFSFRVYASQRSHSNELLVDYFKKQMSTTWLRKRFLYPFVYYAINNAADSFLDTFLSYVISGALKRRSEREVIKFLLCDEIALQQKASFKFYVGLLCHPFDACEILLNHLEIKYAEDGSLTDQEINLLQKLSDGLKVRRIDALLQFARKIPFDFVEKPTAKQLRDHFELDDAHCRFLSEYMDITHDKPLKTENLGRSFSQLARMRSTHYPQADDFTAITTNAHKWRFTDAGRLFNSLLTSIFMVPRRERNYEIRMLMRLVWLSGELSPFHLTSPSASWALSNGRLPISMSIGEIESATERPLIPATKYDTRIWIKVAQWSLRLLERNMKVDAWLDAVRRDIRIAPSFLTGLNWNWLDGVLKASRLAPFRGKPSGAYALLLRQIEDRNADLTPLRIAIEPLAENRSFDEFVDFLINQFRSEAVAFVRFCLTPENILMLRLAPNYTAALSLRIRGLETCVREFHFGPLLDEGRFQQETRTLTASLLLLNIVSGQFEIPWETFRADLAEKEKDSYEAHLSLTGLANSLPLLGTAALSTPHQFKNGKIVEYEFANNLWPIVVLILSIIDGFIQHPAFGLEVLLSTRFRHDTMMREYVRVTTEARNATINGVPHAAQHPIVDEISSQIFLSVEQWLTRRMQTQRPGRSDAIFDSTPTQAELAQLTQECSKLPDLESILVLVTDWLQKRLTYQIAAARAKFIEELGPVLEADIVASRDLILDRNYYRSSDVSRCAALMSTVIKNLNEELANWFSSSDPNDRPSLKFSEIKIAADGVFETQISKGALNSRLIHSDITSQRIPPGQVRLAFDLITEVLANAIKHNKDSRATVRITPWKNEQYSGVIFSSRAKNGLIRNETVEAEKYVSLNDAIFREGNSGLRKIAALAASLIGERAYVKVTQNRCFFHAVVPIWKSNGPAETKFYE